MKATTFLLGLALAACTANGAPTLYTVPPAYLADFPLGAPKQYVLGIMGAPGAQAAVDGREVWTYEIGRGFGLKRWSYVFADGKVYDVRLNDQGPCNGITARQVQGLDASVSWDTFCNKTYAAER